MSPLLPKFDHDVLFYGDVKFKVLGSAKDVMVDNGARRKTMFSWKRFKVGHLDIYLDCNKLNWLSRFIGKRTHHLTYRVGNFLNGLSVCTDI